VSFIFHIHDQQCFNMRVVAYKPSISSTMLFLWVRNNLGLVGGTWGWERGLRGRRWWLQITICQQSVTRLKATTKTIVNIHVHRHALFAGAEHLRHGAPIRIQIGPEDIYFGTLCLSYFPVGIFRCACLFVCLFALLCSANTNQLKTNRKQSDVGVYMGFPRSPVVTRARIWGSRISRVRTRGSADAAHRQFGRGNNI